MSIENRGGYLGARGDPPVEWEEEGSPDKPVSQHIQDRYRERDVHNGEIVRQPREGDTPTEMPLIQEGGPESDTQD